MGAWLEDGISSIFTGIAMDMLTSTTVWEIVIFIFVFDVLWYSLMAKVTKRLT